MVFGSVFPSLLGQGLFQSTCCLQFVVPPDELLLLLLTLLQEKRPFAGLHSLLLLSLNQKILHEQSTRKHPIPISSAKCWPLPCMQSKQVISGLLDLGQSVKST